MTIRARGARKIEEAVLADVGIGDLRSVGVLGDFGEVGPRAGGAGYARPSSCSAVRRRGMACEKLSPSLAFHSLVMKLA